MRAENLTCEGLIDQSSSTFGSIANRLEKHDAAMLQLIGFGGFSLFLAVLYNLIRKHVFKDADNLDTTFDAGGKVSMSLTAVTVASQLLWPADFLQTATVATKGGISGPFWYTVGIVGILFLFPILSVQFKTKAPGAKTFLQIAHVRFGNKAHIIFIIFSLATNLVIICSMLVAGLATFQSMIKDASPEFCFIVMATLFGSYSFVGGLGSTFYVSYFNALLIVGILVYFVVNLFYVGNLGANNILGNIDSVYQQLVCLEEQQGDGSNPYLTFSSEDGIIWGVVGFVSAGATVFGDQTVWQSRVAAKPMEGVIGFFAGTLLWFAVPLTVGSSTGLSYLALSSSNSSFALSSGDIDGGLVMPFIMDKILGYTGGVLVVTLLSMSLMSTGSGEIMGVSSVIVYDIYQVYIRPFRKDHHPLECLLCGHRRFEDTSAVNPERGVFCQCPPATGCPDCKLDHKHIKDEGNLGHQRQFSCPHHGQFHQYQDSLIQFKSWCILWLTIGLIPLGLAVDALGIDLNWMMMVGFSIITSFFPPLLFGLLWVKTTAEGVISGTISGLLIGLAAFLSTASTYEGGLSNFLANMSEKYAVLSGAGTCLLVSFIVTPVVSLFTHKITDTDSAIMEWKKLRDIDNPLHPWGELFREELPELKGQRPSSEQLNKAFRAAMLTAYIGGAILIILIVIVMPAVMIYMHVLDLNQFQFYLSILQILCFVVGGIIIIVAPIQEVFIVLRRWGNRNGKKKINSEERMDSPIKIEETSLSV